MPAEAEEDEYPHSC